ncbi:MAG: hypothetical protein AAFN74_04790 [Myxococcota bacterium]
MSQPDLPYVRWLVEVIERDELGHLTIASTALDGVEQTMFKQLDDPAVAPDLIDQVLRLADGIFRETNHAELPTLLVEMILHHPAGRARLASNPGLEWSQFADQPKDARAPVHDEPTPKDTLRLDDVHNPFKKLR